MCSARSAQSYFYKLPIEKIAPYNLNSTVPKNQAFRVDTRTHLNL
jgi:hypothetical protein